MDKIIFRSNQDIYDTNYVPNDIINTINHSSGVFPIHEIDIIDALMIATSFMVSEDNKQNIIFTNINDHNKIVECCIKYFKEDTAKARVSLHDEICTCFIFLFECMKDLKCAELFNSTWIEYSTYDKCYRFDPNDIIDDIVDQCNIIDINDITNHKICEMLKLLYLKV